MTVEDVEQLPLEHRSRQHPVQEIRPVERADEFDRILQAELRCDVAADARGGGGRVRVHAHAGQQLAQASELAVLGPEVVPPLADAVRLVDRDEADAARRQKGEEGVASVADKPLRRHVQERVAALAQACDDGGLLASVERAVVEHGRDAVADQRVHLILHQRDERGDDQGEAGANDGRRLKAQRLAAAGRQHDQRVAVREDGGHRFALKRPERRVSPVAGDGVLKVRHGFA